MVTRSWVKGFFFFVCFSLNISIIVFPPLSTDCFHLVWVCIINTVSTEMILLKISGLWLIVRERMFYNDKNELYVYITMVVYYLRLYTWNIS